LIRKVGVVSRCDKAGAVEIAKNVIDHLTDKVEVYVDPGTASELNMEGTPVGQMRQLGVEVLITIGGDGTVLRTIQHMDDPLPILPINMGTLGFLVDVEAEDAIPTIDSILSGFEVDERSRFEVWINGTKLPSATNEVVIITSHPAKSRRIDHCHSHRFHSICHECRGTYRGPESGCCCCGAAGTF
jgi:NAD+ kinase